MNIDQNFIRTTSDQLQPLQLFLKLSHFYMGILIATITLQPATADIPIQNLQYEDKINFVSGSFVEYLPDPLFYDTFLPIVLEFPVPKHGENALKLLWQHATVCNSSDSRYTGKLCPVVHHLHKVVANLSADMGFWKDYLPETFPDVDMTASSIEINPSCEQISPHFGNYYTDKEKLEKYFKSLEKCPLGQIQTQPITQPNNWIIDKNMYYTMIERFYSEFYRNLPGTGNVDWVVTLNSYTTIQGILMANNYMESNRVMNAFLTCQAGRIPETFVKTSMLQDFLKNAKSKVHLSHFKFLWEKEADISTYYKLPIADCTFTDDYKLIIRILIPVKTIEGDSKLLRIRTHPFLERVQLKQDNKNALQAPEISLKICKLNTLSSMKMIETDSGLLFESECNPNELCKRSDLTSFQPEDACTSAILTTNDNLTVKHCQLKCFPIDTNNLPIIQRKSSDTFIVVGSSDFKIFINCNGKPIEKLNLQNLGALEVQLPKNCQLSYRNQAFQTIGTGLSTSYREKLSPSVKHILPFQWDTKNASNPGMNATEEENVILNVLEKGLTDLKKYKYETEIGSNSVDGDLILCNDDHHKQTADKQIYVEPTTGSSLSTGFLVQICFLWFLVVILVATNIFLVYYVYTLIKWKKLEAYKDTRIVYSVPASPQFPHKF